MTRTEIFNSAHTNQTFHLSLSNFPANLRFSLRGDSLEIFLKDVIAHDDGLGDQFGDSGEDVVVDAGVGVMSRVHFVLRHVVVRTIDVRVRQVDADSQNQGKRKKKILLMKNDICCKNRA